MRLEVDIWEQVYDLIGKDIFSGVGFFQESGNVLILKDSCRHGQREYSL
jgi:hypothetical protein